MQIVLPGADPDSPIRGYSYFLFTTDRHCDYYIPARPTLSSFLSVSIKPFVFLKF